MFVLGKRVACNECPYGLSLAKFKTIKISYLAKMFECDFLTLHAKDLRKQQVLLPML